MLICISSSEPALPMRVYNWICGFNTEPTPKLTKEEEADTRRKQTDIKENLFWSQVCDINAVIAIAATCFVIGFYA